MKLITQPKEGSVQESFFHVSVLISLFVCIFTHNYAITAALSNTSHGSLLFLQAFWSTYHIQDQVFLVTAKCK